MRTIILLVFLTGVVGCSTLSDYGTMNVQRSGLRGAGDLSVTVMLDQTKDADVEQLKAEITTFLAAMNVFITTGNIAVLTRTELTNRIIGSVANQYAPWVSMALNAALTTLNPQAPLGGANKYRLAAFVYGSLTATANYRVEDRVDERKSVAQKPSEAGLPAWPETTVGNARVRARVETERE